MVKNFLAHMSAGLEIPADILQGASHLELIGREQLRVINHQGIAVYEPDRIMLRLTDGMLAVHGQGLVMTSLDDEQLVVEGKVDHINFAEDGYAE